MPWSGSDFARSYNFSADASAGINILASRIDGEFDNFETGLEACLKLDGTNAPAADFPMGGYKHTNVGQAASTNQYIRLDQLQQQTPIYVAFGGDSDVFSVSTSPVFNALVTGHCIIVSCPSANTTTSVVIKLNGLSAKTVKRPSGADLFLGDVQGLRRYTYNGSQFILENPPTHVMGSTTFVSVANFQSASCSFVSATIYDGTQQIAMGYRDIPVININVGRELTINDRSHLLRHATASTLDLTIPTCASVEFQIGTAILVQADLNSNNVSVSAASGVTFFRIGTGSTGVRVLSASYEGVLKKIGPDRWTIGGGV